MTNAEIIQGEVILRGITEDVHTFGKWKQLGYVVKRGEKAAFSTSLWKKVKKKVEGEEPEEKFILVKSYLFTASQVERVSKAA